MRLLGNLTKHTRTRQGREGATLAETAVVLPVFFVLLFGFIEFGHVFMVIHGLNSAARRAARLGVSETATTADVTAMARTVAGAAIHQDSATIMVKNGDAFEVTGMDASTINYSALPNIELSTAERRQLFIVRVTVPYNDIALLGPRWLGGLTVYGQCVMRKE